MFALVIAVLGLVLSAVTAALFVRTSRHTKDIAAAQADRRTLGADLRKEADADFRALRADFQLVEENLRKEIAEAKLEASQSRTSEYTEALREALQNTLLVTRSASPAEIRTGRAHR